MLQCQFNRICHCLGMQVRFTAGVIGQCKVQWYKDDELVVASKNVQVNMNGTLCNLLIKSIKPEHAGIYKVVAKNEAGEINAIAELTVEGTKKSIPDTPKGKKPTITTKIADQSVTEEGEDVSFVICYEGEPKPEVSWEKNRHAIVSIRRVKVNDTNGQSELKIKNFRSDDAGMYTVSITNSLGFDACSAQLQLAGMSITLFKATITKLF